MVTEFGKSLPASNVGFEPHLVTWMASQATAGNNNDRICLAPPQVDALRTNDVTWERVRSNVDHVVFKSGKRIVLLAEGRLLSLAATSIPSMVTSVNSCTQVSGNQEGWYSRYWDFFGSECMAQNDILLLQTYYLLTVIAL